MISLMWNLKTKKPSQNQFQRYREQAGGYQTQGVREMGKGGQKVYTFSYKINAMGI